MGSKSCHPVFPYASPRMVWSIALNTSPCYRLLGFSFCLQQAMHEALPWHHDVLLHGKQTVTLSAYAPSMLICHSDALLRYPVRIFPRAPPYPLTTTQPRRNAISRASANLHPKTSARSLQEVLHRQVSLTFLVQGLRAQGTTHGCLPLLPTSR